MSEEIADWMKVAGAEGGLNTEIKTEARLDNQKYLRFWIPKGEGTNVIFLTEGDKMPTVWEHAACIAGNWSRPIWVTCLKPFSKPCPWCTYADRYGKFERYMGVFATIIDTKKFKDKNGKERSNLKKLYVAKKKTAQILKGRWNDLKEDEGKPTGKGLKYAMFTLRRTSDDNAAAVGDDIVFKKHIDPETIGEKDREEINYAELLKPDVERAQRLLEAATGKAIPKDDDEEDSSSNEGTGTETKVDYT